MNRILRLALVVPLIMASLVVPATQVDAAASTSARWTGMYVPGAPLDAGPLVALDSQIGSRATVSSYFQCTAQGFTFTQASNAVAAGATPMVALEFWDPANGVDQPSFSLANIAGGSFDTYLHDYAKSAKAFGSPVWLRLFHEMNGNWYPWGGTVNGNSPAEFVAAWRHVHDIFAAEGATNVKFVWCPNADSVPNTSANSISSYWPGDGYVDFVGIDGYNFGGTAWRSFSSIFSSAYSKVTALTSKPLLVAEIGCATTGGDKAAWISDMFKVIPASFPRIGGVAWFDANKERDWRVESDSASLAAFVAGEKSWAATSGGADTVAPSTTSDVVASYAGSAIIHLSASDGPSGSGVAATYYTLDGGVQVAGTTLQVTALGEHTLRFWSTDSAGNVEGAHTVTFNVTTPDRTAPHTASDAISTYTGAANIHLTATDEPGGSGVAHTYYTVDGGAQGVGTTVNVSGVGQHSVEFWSVDNAGNIESPRGHVDFQIVAGNSQDSVAPTTRSDARATYSGNATIHLTATDDAGVAATYYILDGAARAQGTTVEVSTNGHHTLAFWSIDAAGNAEMPTTVQFTVSGATAPSTPAPVTPRITIGTSTVHASVPRPFVLSGQFDPGQPGALVVVLVQKPYSHRWSYSSARVTYGSDGVGGVLWWYRYTPTVHGRYRFMVKSCDTSAPVSGVSPVVDATRH